MAIYKNTTFFLSGGRIYSNNVVVAANQKEQPQYAPPANNTLASIQEQITELSNCSACNGTLSSMPSCYSIDALFDSNFVP
jgi:transcription initiation factor IIE alpha subunit